MMSDHHYQSMSNHTHPEGIAPPVLSQEKDVYNTPSLPRDPAMVSGTVASGLAKLGSEEGRREPLAEVSTNTQSIAAGAKRSHDDALEKHSTSVDDIMAPAKSALLNLDKHATLARDVELQFAARSGNLENLLSDEPFRLAREDEVCLVFPGGLQCFLLTTPSGKSTAKLLALSRKLQTFLTDSSPISSTRSSYHR